MSPLSDDQKTGIIALIREGKMDRGQIAERFGVSPGTVSAVKAHLTMGTYEPSEAEEVIDALEMTFGLERDLQTALRSNLEQLEPGLRITDGGKELTTEAGRVDITAEDHEGTLVVVELKAGTARPDCVAQVLSYMGALAERERRRVRGILVAGDFPPRVVLAARAVPEFQLKRYTFRFLFEGIG